MKNTMYIKGTSQAEVTSNSEKLKLVVFAIIELHLSKGISQLLSKSVENIILKSISGQSESLFGLSFTYLNNWGWFLGDVILWAMLTPLSSLLWTISTANYL